MLIPLLGADPTSQIDDRIVNYDFEDNTGTTTLSFLKWNGTTWVDNPLPAGTYQATTVEGVTDPAVPGGHQPDVRRVRDRPDRGRPAS